jgi:hypothetical protein
MPAEITVGLYAAVDVINLSLGCKMPRTPRVAGCRVPSAPHPDFRMWVLRPDGSSRNARPSRRPGLQPGIKSGASAPHLTAVGRGPQRQVLVAGVETGAQAKPQRPISFPEPLPASFGERLRPVRCGQHPQPYFRTSPVNPHLRNLREQTQIKPLPAKESWHEISPIPLK